MALSSGTFGTSHFVLNQTYKLSDFIWLIEENKVWINKVIDYYLILFYYRYLLFYYYLQICVRILEVIRDSGWEREKQDKMTIVLFNIPRAPFELLQAFRIAHRET